MTRHLVINADDFGASGGVNQAIVEAHEAGVLTSASLMVGGAAAREAAAISAASPDLAVGLHWDVVGEDDHKFPFDDRASVRREFEAQLERFFELTGRAPTHVDSHRHTHMRADLREYFCELVAPLGVPVRGDGRVHFIGGFYAQWEWGVTELQHVSVEALQRIMREEVGEGWTEIACHPGYVTPDYTPIYRSEREAELRTLTDARIPAKLEELGISLESYITYAQLTGRS